MKKVIPFIREFIEYLINSSIIIGLPMFIIIAPLNEYRHFNIPYWIIAMGIGIGIGYQFSTPEKNN